MEYERQIFRVHERSIVGERCKKLTKGASVILLLAGFMNLILVFFAHFFYSNGSKFINFSLNEYKQNITKNGFLIDFPGSDLSSLNFTSEKNRIAEDDENLEKKNFYDFLEKKFKIEKNEFLEILKKNGLEKKFKGKNFLEIFQKRDEKRIIDETDIIKLTFVRNYNKTEPQNYTHILTKKSITNETLKLKKYLFCKNPYRAKLYLEDKTKYIGVIHEIFIDTDLFLKQLPPIKRFTKLEPWIILDIINSYE